MAKLVVLGEFRHSTDFDQPSLCKPDRCLLPILPPRVLVFVFVSRMSGDKCWFYISPVSGSVQAAFCSVQTKSVCVDTDYTARTCKNNVCDCKGDGFPIPTGCSSTSLVYLFNYLFIYNSYFYI